MRNTLNPLSKVQSCELLSGFYFPSVAFRFFFFFFYSFCEFFIRDSWCVATSKKFMKKGSARKIYKYNFHFALLPPNFPFSQFITNLRSSPKRLFHPRELSQVFANHFSLKKKGKKKTFANALDYFFSFFS